MHVKDLSVSGQLVDNIFLKVSFAWLKGLNLATIIMSIYDLVFDSQLNIALSAPF